MRSIHLHYIDSNGAGSNRKWAYQLLISPVMAKGDAYEKWKKEEKITVHKGSWNKISFTKLSVKAKDTSTTGTGSTSGN